MTRCRGKICLYRQMRELKISKKDDYYEEI